MYKILACCEVITARRCILRSSSIIINSNYQAYPSNHRQQRRNFTQDLWMSLSQSKAVATFQEVTIQLHDTSGLPWWATIMLSTILLRSCITLPLSLYQNKILAKVERITTEELPEIAKELKMETALAVQKFGWDEKTAKYMFIRSLKKQYKNCLVRENCHPAKSFVLILFQLPMWIMQSCALRNMLYMLPDSNSLDAQLVYAELSLGGFGWIPNLVEIDHSYILPVALGLINLIIVEVRVNNISYNNILSNSNFTSFRFK